VVVVDGVIAFIEGGEVLDVVEVAIGIVVVEIEVGVVVAFTVVNMSMVVSVEVSVVAVTVDIVITLLLLSLLSSSIPNKSKISLLNCSLNQLIFLIYNIIYTFINTITIMELGFLLSFRIL
jgi:hypothetical protein